MFVHDFKLRPPQLPPAWIERGVAERVASFSGVVSIVAGPGYGKTVVAAQVFAAWTGPKLWYSLETVDGDLAVFAAHFDALLRDVARAPGLQGDASRLGLQPDASRLGLQPDASRLGLQPDASRLGLQGDAWRVGSVKEIASLFSAAVTGLAGRALLVFDDVHALENSASLEILGELTRRLGHAGATVLLCGRSMPLRLHAFAASGRLLKTGTAELAFDAGETRLYLERTVPGASSGAVFEALVRQAEGWPAGLALVGSSGVAARETVFESGARDREEAQQLLFDYLTAEVFGGLTERERRFLFESSILENLDSDICAAVTGCSDAEDLLRSFAARGLFVTRRSETGFSAHALFHEFLASQLAREYADRDIAALHRSAADAFAKRGDRLSAIAHRLHAGDLGAALAELESIVFGLLASGLLSPVRAFLARLGRQRIEGSATLLAASGRLQQIAGAWDDALISLERALGLALERAQYTALAEAVRAMSAILASRGEFARLDALLERALSLPIPEPDRIALLSTRSAVFLETERYDEALALFAEITPSIVARGDLALQGMVLHNTGAAHMLRGDPHAALAWYERALKVKRSAGQRVSSLVTLGNRIHVLLQLGEVDEAERLVAELLEEAADLGNSAMLAHAYESAGALALGRGDLASAGAAYRRARSACDPADLLVLPYVEHGLAQTLLAEGEVSRADELCAKALKSMRALGRSQALAPLVLTRARCALALHDDDRALTLIEECLQLAAQGDDAVLRASANIDAAAALHGAAARFGAAQKSRAASLAEAAVAKANALVEQRDYPFLLRTKAREYAVLREISSRSQSAQPHAANEGRQSEALRIEFLGELRVHRNGAPIAVKAWTRRKARDIFAHLVTLRGRLVPRARLVDQHWPEAEGDSAHDLLRVTVSAVRKAVGDVIKYEEGGYRFVAPAGTVIDVEVYESHLAAARAAEARGAVDAMRTRLQAAIDTYRGDFLDGTDDGAWILRERERLRKPYLWALRRLVRESEDDPSRHAALLARLNAEASLEGEATPEPIGRRA